MEQLIESVLNCDLSVRHVFGERAARREMNLITRRTNFMYTAFYMSELISRLIGSVRL